MTKFVITLAFIIIAQSLSAQSYTTDKSSVIFYSGAKLEDITAENTKSTCMLNLSKNEIAFLVPIKDFKFDKPLMQEHFNQKYMETDKYPKSTFKGKIVGVKTIKGPQQVKAVGKLTIHGITRDIEIPGTINIEESVVKLDSKFVIRLQDFNIERPKLLGQNLAENIDVSINFQLRYLGGS